MEPKTEQKIIEAARKVFIQKGLDGARMQDIADEAGINKALLHYYYRSKEKLFSLVFEEGFKDFAKMMQTVEDDNLSIFEKLEQFVRKDIEWLQKNPAMPLFIVTEIARNAQCLQQSENHANAQKLAQKLGVQLQEAMNKGEIRQMDIRQLMVHVHSMVITPFIMKPMLSHFFGMDDVEYETFIEKRKTEIVDFLRMALRP